MRGLKGTVMGEKALESGSYTSHKLIAMPPGPAPPTNTTRPSARVVAVCRYRPEFIAGPPVNTPVTGLYSSVEEIAALVADVVWAPPATNTCDTHQEREHRQGTRVKPETLCCAEGSLLVVGDGGGGAYAHGAQTRW